VSNEDPIDRLRDALSENPKDPYLLLNLAALLRRDDRIEESSELYVRCYDVYIEQGRPEKAQACLNQLLRFDPDNPIAKLLLAASG
jgi:tetratricopeptide (TPR) repeat protein